MVNYLLILDWECLCLLCLAAISSGDIEFEAIHEQDFAVFIRFAHGCGGWIGGVFDI